MEALYSEKENGKIRCSLCPHLCLIREGHTGTCKVRRNVNGSLITETWGKIAAMHFDPIEKKPLYHFFPGSSILSVGSVGCNMHCRCCQNWQISQVSAEAFNFNHEYAPSEIVSIASATKENLGVAYTYNEPLMWFEYILAVSDLIHKAGLKNVMVSNGFISERPLSDLLIHMDAFNIDLKGFTEHFYKEFTGSSLAPVLVSLKKIRQSGKHLEITCLIIPGQNDDPDVFREMVRWIDSELGNETVLHLSAYHPAYKLGTQATSASDLERLIEIANQKLTYVYAGNLQLKAAQDTKCSKCDTILIKRNGYHIVKISVNDQGKCSICGNKVIIC